MRIHLYCGRKIEGFSRILRKASVNFEPCLGVLKKDIRRAEHVAVMRDYNDRRYFFTCFVLLNLRQLKLHEGYSINAP